MHRYCIVKTIVANLYKEPSFSSELSTQALLREKLSILEERGNWYRVQQWDNYQSWIHKFYLMDKNIDFSNGWDNLKLKKKSINELLSYAKSFVSVPYLWGGKSSLGFDCSGLIQTVFKMSGINMPRDTYQQITKKGLLEINYNNAKPGDLLFFSENKNVNHVAICIGNEEIIHSSGCVKIENLKKNKNLYKKLYKVMSVRNIINE